MATYTWKCDKCDKEINIVNKMADYKKPPDDPCECGSDKFTKQLTKANFEINGYSYKNGYS